MFKTIVYQFPNILSQICIAHTLLFKLLKPIKHDFKHKTSLICICFISYQRLHVWLALLELAYIISFHLVSKKLFYLVTSHKITTHVNGPPLKITLFLLMLKKQNHSLITAIIHEGLS